MSNTEKPIVRSLGDKDDGRNYSLRREWSRAFIVMIVLLVLAAATTIVGLRIVVGELQDTTIQLRLETNTIANIRAEIVSHEQTGHKLLSNEIINRTAYVQQQQYIVGLFNKATSLFPRGGPAAYTFSQVRYSWQYGLNFFGLWGSAVYLMHGDHSAENPIYGASSDGTVALLDSLEQPTLAELSSGVARGQTFENILLIVLIVLFVTALSVTEYSRRRMIRNLLNPLSALHDSAVRIEEGDYEHRVEIMRNDEFGDLDMAFNDMAEAMRSHQVSLEHRATHDVLTGLPNRASLVDRLAAAFGPGLERRSPQVSLLFIDIDDFKDVNDRLGHQGGDELLVKFAARLNGSVRPNDLVCRLGGDEFAVIVAEDHDGDIAKEVALRILDETRVPFVVYDIRLRVTVSIGIATQHIGINDFTEILRNADLAMYQSKHAGKNRLSVFDASDPSISSSDLDI